MVGHCMLSRTYKMSRGHLTGPGGILVGPRALQTTDRLSLPGTLEC